MTINKKSAPKVKKKLPEKSIEVIIGEALEEREAPQQRIIKLDDVIVPSLNEAQLRILTNRTPEWAIKSRVGGGGRQFKYVTHGYVTDMLNKAFGFDWDLVLEPIENGKMYSLTEEEVKGKINRHIAVCGHIVVRVHGNPKNKSDVTATVKKSGFGSQLWLPTMELGDALKAARSDLLKTCAFQLGIALDLYWNEQAELETWRKQTTDTLRNHVAKLLPKNTDIPTNPTQLLSMSMSKHKIDDEQIEKILGKSFDEIMDMDEKEISKAWDKVVASVGSK